MKILMLYLVLVTLLGFTASVLARIVAWEPCPVSREYAASTCIVHQVKVEPCKQVSSEGYCRVRRGRRSSFSFDFTPNFSGGGLQTSVTWKHLYMDLPMHSSWDDPNPCSSTVCPVTSGTRQTYNRTITLFESSWPVNPALLFPPWI